ncbi:Large neutral amino acids transporter small subunit 2 [Lamellibrachia satsuma]|nr:Large neutral amino acids transporter small subunit 2 [Lamellibrachia satsuma]
MQICCEIFFDQQFDNIVTARSSVLEITNLTDKCQPGRKLRGGKVTGHRETGRKETGRKGTGGKTTGVKERGVGETGGKEKGVGETGGKTTGVKERGVAETGGKEKGVGETGGKTTGVKERGVGETGGKEKGVGETEGKGSGQNVMEGIERKSYSAAVIEGVRKRARVFVGDSIVRKTDRVLNKGDDVVVCLPGAKIEAITERVKNIVGSGILTAVNSYNVKWATRVQDIFTYAKVTALLLIIGTGVVLFSKGHTDNFKEPFANTDVDVFSISLAFYQGLFAYNAWNYLNCVIEELKNPAKNLPKAIWFSLIFVTAIYMMTNIAYYTTVSPVEMVKSTAVAVTFTKKPFGVLWWIIPICVALSTFGGVNGILFTTARLFYVGSREGHMPQVLSMVQVNKLTPAPAVIFMGFTSLLYLSSVNIESLINYVGFVNWLAIGMSVLALLYFRWKRPDAPRPIKVWIGLPIIYVICSLFLTIVPIYASPWETGMGMLIMASGVPVYLICVSWKKKPEGYNEIMTSLTINIQKLLMVIPEEKSASV